MGATVTKEIDEIRTSLLQITQALGNLDQRLELAIIKAMRKHEAIKHKSISLGNLLTIVTILAVGAAAYFGGN